MIWSILYLYLFPEILCSSVNCQLCSGMMSQRRAGQHLLGWNRTCPGPGPTVTDCGWLWLLTGMYEHPGGDWWCSLVSLPCSPDQHSPQWHWDPPTPARHLSSEAYQVQAGTARWWGEPVITSCVSSASSAVWLSQFTRGLWWVRSDVLSCDGKKDVSLQSEDTVWVGASPALQFLLRCGLVERRNSGLSTDDIYNKKILHRGVQKLQVSPRPHLPRRHSNWNDISERFPRNWWDYHRPGSLIIKSWKSFTRESASGGNRSWD